MLQFVLLLSGLRAATGLDAPNAPPSDSLPGAYQRARVEFAEVTLLKPAPRNEENLSFKLAPLIIQEIRGGHLNRDVVGRLPVTGSVRGRDTAESAIYFDTDTAQIKGRNHARYLYLWFYATRPDSPGGAGLPAQGVRLTLNSAGAPVIWEVLAEADGAKLVFVSRSLEEEAAIEFGGPLPGRRHSIERSLAEAPGVVVPLILEEAPMAMGPIVYLNAGNRYVTTVLCRCMPAQAGKLLATSTYELIPANSTSSSALLGGAKAPAAFWPGERKDENRVERLLRLPKSF